MKWILVFTFSCSNYIYFNSVWSARKEFQLQYLIASHVFRSKGTPECLSRMCLFKSISSQTNANRNALIWLESIFKCPESRRCRCLMFRKKGNLSLNVMLSNGGYLKWRAVFTFDDFLLESFTYSSTELLFFPLLPFSYRLVITLSALFDPVSITRTL